MSHTDKDDPLWLRVQWWVPDHHRCQYDWRRTERACDLPPEPERHRDRLPLLRARTTPGCAWWPDLLRLYHPGSCPAWFARLHYTKPTRRRVRDDCRRAAQEYRATGEVDAIPPTGQHRHQASWDWW